jgi:hypothetical protein
LRGGYLKRKFEWGMMMIERDELKAINKARAEKILNQIKARESTNKRTIETRKKILLGAMLQEWMRTGEIEQARVEAGLIGYLTRQQDRDLFGLDKTAGSGEAERAGVEMS